jgi:hypothetical protein
MSPGAVSQILASTTLESLVSPFTILRKTTSNERLFDTEIAIDWKNSRFIFLINLYLSENNAFPTLSLILQKYTGCSIGL